MKMQEGIKEKNLCFEEIKQAYNQSYQQRQYLWEAALLCTHIAPFIQKALITYYLLSPFMYMDLIDPLSRVIKVHYKTPLCDRENLGTGEVKCLLKMH